MPEKDLDEYDSLVGEGDITMASRTVKTPIAANEDGSGHDTEMNVQDAFVSGDHLVTRSKVGDRGWSIWHYRLDDGPRIQERVASELGAQESARLARKTIVEVSA